MQSFFDQLNSFLNYFHMQLESNSLEFKFALLIALILISLALRFVLKSFLFQFLNKISYKTVTNFDNYLIENHLIAKISTLLPLFLFYIFHKLLFFEWPIIYDWGKRLLITFLVIQVVKILFIVLESARKTYDDLETSKNRPIKSYVQMIKLLIVLIALIVITSTLANKSPLYLLSGLGALTAILLLVFKDTILGLVASVQLATQDMVRIGDWVEMPSQNADGEVLDISLTTIKIKNWDNTLSMVPPSAFVSASFKNWRHMSESGGRRIKRSLLIDSHTLKICDDEMLNRFRKIDLLADFLKEREDEIKNDNSARVTRDPSYITNKRQLTNIGIYRAYVAHYLSHHKNIRKDMSFLVRQLAPTAQGLPLEIYVFTNTTAWSVYESIQSDIFDHLLSVINFFDLKVYQRVSSVDFRQASTSSQVSHLPIDE